MLGLIGVLLLNAHKLSVYVKENIGFTVMLNNEIKEIDIFIIQKNLDAKKYVKSTDYITRERAAQELIDELGEDFINYLGFNPLPPSIDVKMYAQYANPDSIAVIEKEFKEFSQIEEIVYHKSLLEIINDNINTISMIILGFSAILLLIALALINNTIRLSVYSKRFLIRTMQLVGANNTFILKPFIMRSVLHGSYAAIIALAGISAIIYYSNDIFENIISFHEIDLIAILYACVIMLGIFITSVSTFFAVNRYLNIELDKLYI